MLKKTKSKNLASVLLTSELLVLIAVTRIDEAYGATVYEALQQVVSISFGAVYTSLEKLTAKGYLTTELGDIEPVPGGRARKYYRVTPVGRKALESMNEVMEAVRSLERSNTRLEIALAASGKTGR